MKERWKKLELKWRMIILLVTGWLVPIVVISIIVSFVMSQRLTGQMTENVTLSADRAVQIIDSQLESIRRESRNATYLGVVAKSYEEYQETLDEQKLYDDMSLYLAQQYRYNALLNSAMLFFTDNPKLFYSTYNSGKMYDNVLAFKQEHLRDALLLSPQIDTSMYLFSAGDSLYLIRNLVDSSYNTYAMLVLDINMEAVFSGLDSVWGSKIAGVYLDGGLVYGDRREYRFDTAFLEVTDGCDVIRDKGDYIVYSTERQDGRMLTYMVILDNNIVNAELRYGMYIMFIILCSLVPLSIVVFRFFNNKVTKPVRELVKASWEISEENYGYEITAQGGSRDFDYLNESFNGMSKKLKYQFEQIYLEELAVRDANIKALQSQINPHFINNTLEIINWEARLNGVYKVSSMIEALSTMLNATLNRKDVSIIPLHEELEYVDAYLYVISERMGKRLSIEKNVDENLMQEEVPRLIAQPIIENAVEHGIRTIASGRISLKVYAEEQYMYIEIRNTGNMTKEDEERVEMILSSSDKDQLKHSVSIGINNVNRRLKLMYGEECGLKIYNEGDETVSLLKFIRKEK